jgi:hypothetical protein
VSGIAEIALIERSHRNDRHLRHAGHHGPELSVFDRYEARAASRRKSAVRQFDEAHARLMPPRKATAPERS